MSLDKYNAPPPDVDENEAKPQHKKSELADLLDDFSAKSAQKLWEIADDEDHPWHKRHGFEALKTLFNKVTPVRKDKESAGPAQTINLQALFHSNSLPPPNAPNAVIATEVKELEHDPD